jgi:tripartite-type tricarboxylate transporter receptor subunit TctC
MPLAGIAQNYPTKPVRAIISFPPGSATDIVGRVIAQKVSEYWGQQVIADNRGGAGGSIAAAITANAVPDGYTLLINSNAHVVNPSMFIKLPFDTLKDFVDIMPLAGQPNVLAVNPSSKVKSLSEFLKDAKARPGQLNFAFAGIGSGTHLNTEKLKMAAGIDFTPVPYKGSGEIIIDLVAGRVDAYFTPISAGLPFFEAGKLRAIAVSTAKRSPLMPNVPTVAESGVPGFEFILWFGLWGPTGIPAPIVDKVRRDFARALAEPGVSGKLGTLGNSVMIMTPPEFNKFVRREIAETAQIIKVAGIKPQ